MWFPDILRACLPGQVGSAPFQSLSVPQNKTKLSWEGASQRRSHGDARGCTLTAHIDCLTVSLREGCKHTAQLEMGYFVEAIDGLDISQRTNFSVARIHLLQFERGKPD